MVAATHIAIYKLGAIALPLAMLFGVEAISYRLEDSGARALITNAQGLAKLAPRASARRPQMVLSIDGEAEGAQDFHALAGRASPEFTPVPTAAEDPALMVYTSGTTGPPKGALHAHRVLLGHLPGIEFPHEFLAAAGRPILDPGRLGLGRRAPQCATAGTALRRAGGGAKGREVRSRGSVRADGEEGSAQRFHPADGAAHDALGGSSARQQFACARSGRAARRSAPRPGVGKPFSVSPSTSSTARPNAISCSPRAPESACRGRARSASRCRATSSP